MANVDGGGGCSCSGNCGVSHHFLSRKEKDRLRGGERNSKTSTNANVYAKLLSLESVLYHPRRWQSWYVKKLAYNLSAQSYIQRRRERTLIKCCGNTFEQYIATTTTDRCSSSIDQKLNSSLNSFTMIKAMHQFSTIKTVYSDDQKSFVSVVNPLRAMLVQVDFEVFGDVSGVYFTKYAKSMCEHLKLRGWIRVSPRGSVYGQIQGEKENVDEMALWLRLQGSPNSKIVHCTFKNWQIIDSCDFRNFTIRY